MNGGANRKTYNICNPGPAANKTSVNPTAIATRREDVTSAPWRPNSAPIQTTRLLAGMTMTPQTAIGIAHHGANSIGKLRRRL